MPTEKTTHSDEPTDRLTRMCDAMRVAMETHPEYQGDKAVIMLDDGERGGIVMFGYEDGIEAMVDLLMHVRAVFKAHGKDLSFVPLETRGRG